MGEYAEEEALEDNGCGIGASNHCENPVVYQLARRRGLLVQKIFVILKDKKYYKERAQQLCTIKDYQIVKEIARAGPSCDPFGCKLPAAGQECV